MKRLTSFVRKDDPTILRCTGAQGCILILEIGKGTKIYFILLIHKKFHNTDKLIRDWFGNDSAVDRLHSI